MEDMAQMLKLEINQPRNTIEINIVVDEGTGAKIKKINIIGNEIFSDEDLKFIGVIRRVIFIS